MPLHQTARQAARLEAQAAANAAPPAPPRRKRDHRAEALRLRGTLALVRRLLAIGTPPARVVAVVDAAMAQMDKEQR